MKKIYHQQHKHQFIKQPLQGLPMIMGHTATHVIASFPTSDLCECGERGNYRQEEVECPITSKGYITDADSVGFEITP